MRTPLIVALVAVLAVAACTTSAPTPTEFPTVCCAPSLPPTFSPTPPASPTPTSTVPPITLPTPLETGTTPCASDTAGEPAVPPDAYLLDTSSGGFPGKLGSYTFCGTSADALPPRAESLVTVNLGTSTPGVQMQGGWGITGYRASYWDAGEWQGDETALSSDTYVEPAIAFDFSGPPAGDWMLAIHVTFPANGDAVYYWHVTVP